MTFLGGEWNHPPNQPNSFKSIGFTCKCDNRVWQYLQIRFHYFIDFVDDFVFFGRTQKRPNHLNCQKVLDICVKRTHQCCDIFDANLIVRCFSFAFYSQTFLGPPYDLEIVSGEGFDMRNRGQNRENLQGKDSADLRDTLRSLNRLFNTI